MAFERYIPDSPGARVPEWMTDPEEIAEYRMSEEYKHDLTHVPDPDIYEPSDYEQHEMDKEGEYLAEMQAERLEQARREAEEVSLEELEAAAEILQQEIERRKDE